MKKIYYKVTSNNYPIIVDTTSSPTTVYLRKNVTEVEIIDPITEEAHTEYHYEETAITKDEYISLLQERVADVEEVLADILYGGEE